MGYYYDVTLRCRSGVFEELKRLWKTTAFPKPDEITKSGEDYYIQWFSVKWSQHSLPRDKSPNDILSDVLHKLSTPLAEPSYSSYALCTIGEDISDIRCVSNTDCYDLDIIRDVSIPLNGEQISITS